MEKKNFPLYTRVQCIACGEMTGKTGTILGKNIVHIEDHYIVLLDNNVKLADGYEVAAFTVTEHCLEHMGRIDTNLWLKRLP